jgi:ribosomal-protein-alanine N-acetyltransferase
MNPRKQYFLESPRLGFRCWTAEDLPLALALWGDIAVTRLNGGPFSPEQIERRLGEEVERMEAVQVQYWPIFLRTTGEHVGCAGLRPRMLEGRGANPIVGREQDPIRVHELGYLLFPRYWGQGLATEAGRAVIEFAFASIPRIKLFAGHHPENAASRHVLEKLGFHYVGHEFYPPSGLHEPTYLLARSDFVGGANDPARGCEAKPSGL